MDSRDVRRMWEGNAEAWTMLSRMGCDKYRDGVNTPAFLEMLPDVSGAKGLDIGCGEGHNTRLVARRGARMTGVDVSRTFVAHATEAEADAAAAVRYVCAEGEALPFADEGFDFAMSTMSLMDMADHERAIGEAHRVIRPGGFFQFSILHPCFSTPRWEWLLDEDGDRVAVACGDYFAEEQGQVDEWIFGAAPAELREQYREFRIPRFWRTLGSWLNLLIDAGFVLERVGEPFADDRAVQACPHIADTRVVAYFLHLRCRKRDAHGDVAPAPD